MVRFSDRKVGVGTMKHAGGIVAILPSGTIRVKALATCLLLTAATSCGPEASTDRESRQASESEEPPSQSPVSAETTSEIVVFEGARLITGDGSEPIERSAFVVENGRFTQVGRQGEVDAPAAASRVDLSGKTVIPGLIDLHTHIGYEMYTGVNGVPVRPEGGGAAGRGVFNFGAHNFTRENILDHMKRFAYFGVAAAWSAGYTFGQHPYELRDEIMAGEHPDAARYLPSGPGLTTLDAIRPGNARQSTWAIATEEDARYAVRWLARKNVEMLKLWNEDMSPPVYGAIIDEAHRHGIRVGVHPGAFTRPEESTEDMVRAGVDVLLHPIDPDEEFLELVRQRERPLYGVFASASDRWAYHVPYFDDPPTLLRHTVAPSQLGQLREKYGEQARQGTEAQRRAAVRSQAWEDRMESMRLLRGAGLRLALGSDAGGTAREKTVGFFAHVDMENMSTSEMTPADVIVAATRTAAEALGLDDLGTIAPGKSAAFVVLDANPLDDILNTRRIHLVYLRGVEVDRDGLRAKWAESWRNDPG